MSSKVLFACSKCFSRHPYEELSSGQQLCKVNTNKYRVKIFKGKLQQTNIFSNVCVRIVAKI